MNDREKPGLRSTMRKFKNPILNKYIPSGVWGIHLPGEIKKFLNLWMKWPTYMP
jgi:hypothetical protein